VAREFGPLQINKISFLATYCWFEASHIMHESVQHEEKVVEETTPNGKKSQKSKVKMATKTKAQLVDDSIMGVSKSQRQ